MALKFLINDKRWPVWLGQLIRFSVVGLSNSLVDFGVYWLLTRLILGWQWYLLANLLAFFIANINSYWWNSRWSFKRTNVSSIGYARFLYVSVIYVTLLEFGLWWLVAQAGWYDLLAKLFLLCLGTVGYFLAVRRWVFRERSSRAGSQN